MTAGCMCRQVTDSSGQNSKQDLQGEAVVVRLHGATLEGGHPSRTMVGCCICMRADTFSFALNHDASSTVGPGLETVHCYHWVIPHTFSLCEC